MKVALIYDRQTLSDYWKRGGVWSAYRATRLALTSVGVEVSSRTGNGEDAVVFWDALEAASKYAELVDSARIPMITKLGGYFGGDPDEGIPWDFLDGMDVVVVSSPDMIPDADERCGGPVSWIADGYDSGVFYPADERGDTLVACCGDNDYRGWRRVASCGLPVQVTGAVEGDPAPCHTGWMTHNELGDFYRDAGLFLSLIGRSQGFTISRLEAMACGLPLVCTDQGWQGLCDGAALTFSLEEINRRPTAVRDAVLELTDDDLLGMRKSALERAAEYTPEKVGCLWLDLLEGL